jgi:replicative DNA helicase
MGDMERGTLSEEQMSDLVDIIGAMDALPMYICNRAKSPAEIRSKVSEIHEKHGLGMVVVDYLQRIRADGKHRSKDEEIGEISFALKDIAMDYKVPVLLLSQLNRSATNVRPNMSMLRESGNIEQDADVIILLHDPDREDLKPKRQADWDAVKARGGEYREIIVDGNRHGRTGIMCVGFYGDRMRYEEIK